MTTRSPTLSLETALYGLIFLAVLGVRLLNLGAHPLNDVEAREALAVLAQLRGQADPALSPNSPAYFFITYFSFLVFGASEASARLGPALAGSALVLVPSLFRDLLGRPAALASSGVLAVSASLLAASRSADGTLPALLALAVAAGALWRFLRNGRTAWVLAAAAALAAAAEAAAQGFPERRISMVVGFGAGGMTDVTSRMLGRHMEKTLGTTVIIENKAGAGGTVAINSVAQMPADGHTMVSVLTEGPFTSAYQSKPISSATAP